MIEIYVNVVPKDDENLYTARVYLDKNDDDFQSHGNSSSLYMLFKQLSMVYGSDQLLSSKILGEFNKNILTSDDLIVWNEISDGEVKI